MVTIRNTIKTVAIPLAITSFMVIQGCNKEEEAPATKTNLLVGDWELTEVGGDDYTADPYSYLFKFQSSGDFEFCYESDEDPTENYCYSGAKWKWQDSNEKVIIINQFQDEIEEWKLDVTVLDETKLEGTLTSTYDDGGTPSTYTQSVKFVKVN